MTATTSPETAGYLHTTVKNSQFTWSSPATNRLLLEAGVGIVSRGVGAVREPGQSDARPREHHRAGEPEFQRDAHRRGPPLSLGELGARLGQPEPVARSTASYVTGAHSMKFGYDGSYLVEDIENHGNDLNLAYTFNGGKPASLTESLRVFIQRDRVRTTRGCTRRTSGRWGG